MIEIFKTNVKNQEHATHVARLLIQHLPTAEINFDLEDCDNILRVKAKKICAADITELLAKHGVDCYLL